MKRKELLIALGVVCLVIAGFGCYNFLRNNNVTSGEEIIGTFNDGILIDAPNKKNNCIIY